MLPGLTAVLPAASAASRPTQTVPFHAYIAGTGSAPSFSDVALGTPSTNRYIIVAVAAKNTNTFPGNPPSVNSVTVAGQACTKVADIGTGIQRTKTTLWITSAPVTSGTTGTVSVAMSLSTSAVGVAVWSADLSSPTPNDTATSFLRQAGQSATIDFPAGGILVAAVSGISGATSTTWTSGAVKDFETTFSANEFSGASSADLSGGTSQTVSVNSAENGAMVAATWSL